MNIDPETLKVILAITATALGIFAPKIWEKLKPYWPNMNSVKSVLGFSTQETAEDEEGLEAYTLHEIAEYLIADRKAAKDDVGVQLVGTLGKHLYDLRLEQKK